MGNAGAALPPEADIQRLDTNPVLLADFGRVLKVRGLPGAITRLRRSLAALSV